MVAAFLRAAGIGSLAGALSGLVAGGIGIRIGPAASVGSVIINPNNIDFRRFGSPGLNALLFALLFILYGLVL